jgi:hypothetical protein
MVPSSVWLLCACLFDAPTGGMATVAAVRGILEHDAARWHGLAWQRLGGLHVDVLLDDFVG